jgi:hypothetical protein
VSKHVDYSPIDSLRKLRGEMQRKIQEAGELVIPGSQVAPPLVNVEKRADPCCVLLKMLTDGGPIPDDFKGLRSSQAIREHVRSDGAVYRGAFELQGRPDSVVLVYGDPTLTDQQAERLSVIERPALERRYSDWTLGPFSARQLPRDPMVS